MRDGTLFESLTASADAICTDKSLCRVFLEELGFPVPSALVVDPSHPDSRAVAALIEQVGSLVAKPVDGTDGVGVELGLRTAEQIRGYCRRWPDRPVLLEEELSGIDLRLQAVGGDLVCGCVRVPAHVRGDGVATVRELIDERNVQLGRENPANRIEIDEGVHGILAGQGLSLDAIPSEGFDIRLKQVANIAQGGAAIDVTDRLHPRYAEWVRRVALALDISIFSLDLIAQDPASDPDSAARVLEVNSRPAWLHHTFSEGRTHDIPGMILHDLFPGS